MGTLYSQPARNCRQVSTEMLDDFLGSAVGLAKKHGITVSEVIAAAAMLEQGRANDLYVSNGDAFDEQIAGIGTELQRIAAAFESLDRK